MILDRIDILQNVSPCMAQKIVIHFYATNLQTRFQRVVLGYSSGDKRKCKCSFFSSLDPFNVERNMDRSFMAEKMGGQLSRHIDLNLQPIF